jgi:radical SAM superfamily enzyme YgiQ (UPF0313 family)
VRIGTLAFAGSDSTLGLDVVCGAIGERFPSATVAKADADNVRSFDYLLVSLYWWRDAYALIRFLSTVGIDPRKREPVIIIGGMAALTPRPLAGYFHYCVIGDGEEVICSLLESLENGEHNPEIPGLWRDGPCTMAVAKSIPAKPYVDLRTNKTTRIEIARGCRGACAFCELAYIKPYREQSYEVIRHLVMTSPTKTIALFAPDRSSHSKIGKIDAMVERCGKNNSGSDARLDTLPKVERISRVRFGVEGFSAKTRKKLHKVPSRKALVDGLVDVATRLKTPKGPPHTSATMYLIGDLPGEGRREIAEMWDTLGEFDAKLAGKFTLFVSVSSFAPSPFTPMQRCGIDPWTDANDWFEQTRPRFDKLVIATRGKVISAPQRLAQMLTIRGDERARLAMHWLATKGWGLLKSTKTADAKIIMAVCEKAGFPPNRLFEQIDVGDGLPWSNIEPVRVAREWAHD